VLEDAASASAARALKAAEFNGTPWNLAAGFDFAFPQVRGERPADAEVRARYFATLDQLQTQDPEIRRLMAEVFHLVRPLSALLEEPVASRVHALMQKPSPRES